MSWGPKFISECVKWLSGNGSFCTVDTRPSSDLPSDRRRDFTYVCVRNKSFRVLPLVFLNPSFDEVDHLLL